MNYIDPYGLWSFSVDAYAGAGGGITFGRNEDTGSWFYETRLGIGIGGGIGIDVLDKGPQGRELRQNPYGEVCDSLSSGDTGSAVGTFYGLGFDIGPYGYGVGAEAGKLQGPNGASYRKDPRFGPNWNPAGRGFRLGAGGSFGISGSGWYK